MQADSRQTGNLPAGGRGFLLLLLLLLCGWVFFFVGFKKKKKIIHNKVLFKIFINNLFKVSKLYPKLYR